MEIIQEQRQIEIYGYSGQAVNKDYKGIVFRLMDRMWQTVKQNGLSNKGINIWIYDKNEEVFAGVELFSPPHHNTDLETKSISLNKYAYHKHIGSYHLIPKAGLNMREELQKKGLITDFPYIEIYGHWNSDEDKLETELLIALK
jgi:effector-binding domain-containing protein